MSDSSNSGASNVILMKLFGVLVGFSFIGLFLLNTYNWALWFFVIGILAGFSMTIFLLVQGVDNPSNQQTKVAIVIRYSLIGFCLAAILAYIVS